MCDRASYLTINQSIIKAEDSPGSLYAWLDAGLNSRAKMNHLHQT